MGDNREGKKNEMRWKQWKVTQKGRWDGNEMR